MKKNYYYNIALLMCLLCTVSANLYSQSFQGGVLGGLVGSQVAGDTYSGFNKAGLTGGGWIALDVTPRSQLQMELSFIQKGSRENPDDERGKYDTYIMRISYVELPVLYRLKYSTVLNFETGLALNFLMHHDESLNGYELTNPFAQHNLNFILGLSYNLSNNVRVNFRTNNSLFSIRKEKVTGDVWRFWDHGQFSDALVLSLYVKF